MKTVIGVKWIIVSLILHKNAMDLDAETSAHRISSAGYTSETYNITTKDGYGLTLFRIKNPRTRRGKSQPAPIVLMMHGLLSSSDCWVVKGLENALAYELADRGYDVWLGNSRGNTYGQRHTSLAPSDHRFWQFSWHEIGTIDLPLIMDYILKKTQQSSMHYIGHSQGSVIMFVLLSMHPEYNEKLKTLHMLAPVAYMKNVRSPLFKLLRPIFGRYSFLDPLLGDSALFQPPLIQKLFGIEQCRHQQWTPEMCKELIYLVYGGKSDYFQPLLKDLFDSHPAPASTHQAIHFIQLMVSGYFRQYDFGPEGNRKRYNRLMPPEYNVRNINTRFPIHLYYSDYDELSAKLDVEKLSNVLGNKSVRHFIDLKNFAHIDFLLAYNVQDVINRPILEDMSKTEDILKQERN
ncbi:lipase 3-like isoform X2 [Haematobia irritans]|uniref:lipase 3-like isoform X2 n=1 Tax=Haematobia irritans TaxID=7368 RepID=UPI003F4F4855